jgi:hypothetical protein
VEQTCCWLVSFLMLQKEGTNDTLVESNLHLVQHYLLVVVHRPT